MEMMNEDDQVDALKRWWGNYGATVIIAVIMGVTLMLGYQYWQKKQAETLARASLVYQQMLDNQETDNLASQKKRADFLISKYPDTVYASMASLFLAKFAVAADELILADTQLTWVITHAKPEVFQDIARLRKARILSEAKQYDSVLALLDEVKTATFKPLAANLRGDVFLAQGDLPAAKAAFESVVNASTGLAQLQAFVTMKLSNLAEETT